MNYWYCLGWKEKMIEGYIKDRFNYETTVEKADGQLWDCFTEKTRVMVIWTREKNDMPSLVHECVHAANFTLQSRGWKPDFENDEPLTYLVESIFRNAIK